MAFVPCRLSEAGRSMLAGEHDDPAAFVMRLLVAFAEGLGAPGLLDIPGAHIDGCLYHGQVNLDFVEPMASGGGRVRVPTTLNVGAIDLIHPERWLNLFRRHWEPRLEATDRDPAPRAGHHAPHQSRERSPSAGRAHRFSSRCRSASSSH